MKYILALCICGFVLTCSKPEEQQPKPDLEQFFQVYQDFLSMSAQDSLGMQNKEDLLDSALAKHDMDPQEFDATLNYLETHPEDFLKAFESFDSTMRERAAPPMD